MTFNLLDIWQHMGTAATVVAVALLAMGLASLTVVVERAMALRSSRAASRRFSAQIGDPLRAGDIEAVLDLSAAPPHRGGHLTRLVRDVLTTYRHAVNTADAAGLPPAERTRRHLERALEVNGTDLRRGMSILASVGSTAPFVGLLGTVVGIISAFQGIADTGSGGLAAVSAGISEALIETALGLAVAIPAVLAFNALSARMAAEEQGLSHAGGELLDAIEDWEERRLAPSPIGAPAFAGGERWQRGDGLAVHP